MVRSFEQVPRTFLARYFVNGVNHWCTGCVFVCWAPEGLLCYYFKGAVGVEIWRLVVICGKLFFISTCKGGRKLSFWYVDRCEWLESRYLGFDRKNLNYSFLMFYLNRGVVTLGFVIKLCCSGKLFL